MKKDFGSNMSAKKCIQRLSKSDRVSKIKHFCYPVVKIKIGKHGMTYTGQFSLVCFGKEEGTVKSILAQI